MVCADITGGRRYVMQVVFCSPQCSVMFALDNAPPHTSPQKIEINGIFTGRV
jgi:hypothetical protein